MSWILDKLTGAVMPPQGLGGAVLGLGIALDDKGVAFDPGSCKGSWTYDSAGKMSTEIRTDLQGVVRVKTYMYDLNGKLAAESFWVQAGGVA